MMTKHVEEDKAFWFSVETGPTGFVAHNLEEMKRGFRHVPMKSIKFHLRDEKNDFAAWVREVMEEAELADRIQKIKEEFSKGSLKGIALRKNLIKTVTV